MLKLKTENENEKLGKNLYFSLTKNTKTFAFAYFIRKI